MRVSHVCRRFTHGDCLTLIALHHRELHKPAHHMHYGQANARLASCRRSSLEDRMSAIGSR